jgi:oligopeptide transport system ATP-binding protein
MRQRILIAMALAGEPLVIIADEPTSMLDPDNQLNIMRLIRNSVCKKQAGLIIITHDLSLLSSVDTIIVMYASRIVELGTADNILKTPNHPYTRKLLALTHSDTSKRLPVISGSILPPKRYFDGCHFFERCEYAMPVCQKQKPRLLPLGGSHYTACQLNVG